MSKIFATLISDEAYLPGLFALWFSIKQTNPKYPLVALVTANLGERARHFLGTMGMPIVDIARLEAADMHENLKAVDSRFAETWNKLAVFSLTQYERIVLLDSDMIVADNIDELLEMPLAPRTVAAAHACTCNPRRLAHYPESWKPENCAHTLAEYEPMQVLSAARFSKPTHHLLNSGTVVLQPHAEDAREIRRVLDDPHLTSSFMFPDQDLMAHVFRGRFVPLSYRYNALKTLALAHPYLWDQSSIKIFHYILDKPWLRPKQATLAHHPLHGLWWATYEAGLASEAPYWACSERAYLMSLVTRESALPSVADVPSFANEPLPFELS